LVDAIYEAGLDSQQWPATLAHLAAATRVSVSDLKMADIGRVRFTMFSAGMDPAAIEAYNKYYYRLDPITPELERKPAGALVTDRDIVPKTFLRRTEFYNDWARPQDFDDCAVITLFRDEARLAMLCLAAPERLDAFGAESLDLLRQLIPHLQRATQVTLKMADLEALHGGIFAALDCLSEGVLLADSNARVVFANRAAEAMFARADGIGVQASSVCAASSGQTVALRRLIALSARRENIAGGGGSVLLGRPSGRRPLSVTVAPMRRETEWYPVASPIAIVFVADPEKDDELPEARLRALYGMTRAEAIVAGVISKGGGIKAAARVLGIAPSTARTHLHRVFDKTGATRQAELAHLVGQITSFSGALTEDN